MSKTSNKTGKSDADKAGKKRMKAYEARKNSPEPSNDEQILTAYQKIEPGNWEKITIVKRKDGYEKL